jgi:GT2 family glycosyltransferase
MSAVNSPSGGHTALIVVNYGSSELLRTNLAPIGKRWPELDIIVVDCWTNEREHEDILRSAAEFGWTTVLLDENVGFGAGVNRGAARAIDRGAGVLIVLNPDATLDDDSARLLAEEARSEQQLLVAPIVRRPDGALWTEGTDLYLDDGSMAGVRHRSKRPGRQRMFWVSGACFALSVALWQQVGGFDETFFLYWEDVDLCRRVRDAGGECRIVEAASAVHDEGGTHENRRAGKAKSETYYYYNIRNRLLFARLALDPAGRRSWLRSTARVSFLILLQGGRRQLLQGMAPWRALLRGVVDGLRQASGPLPARITTLASRRARLYYQVRTAHLERAHELRPAAIVYLKHRYDFDISFAKGLELVNRRPVGAALLLRRSNLEALEVNEPLMLQSAILTALGVFAVRFGRGRRVRIVSYAIGNANPLAEPPSGWKSRLRRRVEAAAAHYIWRQLDAIAYGTDGAREIYQAVMPLRTSLRQALVPALPAPRDDVDLTDRGPSVVFLGAFVQRKGLPLLLEAWPLVVAAHPEARLTLVGKGTLLPDVRQFCAMQPSASLLVDPPRAEIRDVLARSKTLVLPSQPTPSWREQVGLPILEGLQSGCTIVTTAETGIAEWLAEHGHGVLPADADAASLATAIIRELGRAPCVAEVLESLPREDGRSAADRWLFADRADAEAARLND